MEVQFQEKPCLVEAGRGFSVSYKGRFLYSKYAPERAIEGAVSSLELLPNTLILAFSPVLWLGLSSLLQKLPENCFILGVEFDKKLYDFSKTELEKLLNKKDNISNEKLRSQTAILPFELNDYIVNILSGEEFPAKKETLQILPHISNFRRAVPLELSAGTQFEKEKYIKFASLTQNTIASFWKNRITLTRLGRLFSKNLFKNLSNLPQSLDLRKIINSISSPIFVFGAGESIEETLNNIPKSEIHKCFIIAVDAAATSLKAHNIKIDAIVAVESQLAIEKAYIGNTAKNSLLIADITSRKAVTRHSKNTAYFASKYTDAQFLRKLSHKTFFPPLFPPLGSVGLTAVQLALLLRKNKNIPVFFSGLDFSFSCGRTHANNTPAHIARLCSSNRLHSQENYEAAFKTGAKLITGKNNIPVYTDTALTGYAKSFADVFSGSPNLYDAGKQGLFLSIPEISSEKLTAYLKTTVKKETMDFSNLQGLEIIKTPDILSFLEAEEKALNRIKELLMFGKDVACCSCSLEEELQSLIAPREYLYLHFPDGYKCNTKDISFLKRVRSQIDFFLKDIKNELKTDATD